MPNWANGNAPFPDASSACVPHRPLRPATRDHGPTVAHIKARSQLPPLPPLVRQIPYYHKHQQLTDFPIFLFATRARPQTVPFPRSLRPPSIYPRPVPSSPVPFLILNAIARRPLPDERHLTMAFPSPNPSSDAGLQDLAPLPMASLKTEEPSESAGLQANNENVAATQQHPTANATQLPQTATVGQEGSLGPDSSAILPASTATDERAPSPSDANESHIKEGQGSPINDNATVQEKNSKKTVERRTLPSRQRKAPQSTAALFDRLSVAADSTSEQDRRTLVHCRAFRSNSF